jgi:hypothetical protein
LVGNGLALSAALTCVIILLLPLFSRYKAILSPLAFTLIAAALFSPVLIHAVSTLAVMTPRRLRRSMTAIAAAARRGSGYWKRHEVTFERAAVLFGLGALAIAQPIFEVVSNSPEFFAARGTTATTALTAVFAICFGIPLLLTGLERVIRLFSAGAAKTLFGFAVAVLAAVIVMPWFQRGHVLGFPWNAAASGFIGMAVALADARIGIIRQFLTVLAPAALVVPTLFLLEPAVRQSFLPSESAAAIQTVERTPPIVFVVFDELPLNSLLDVDGNIDAERYPNFAALARDAYWFRNASTVASNTAQAVPAILSGRYPTTLGDMPTLRYYPVNLFTALARHYRIFASLRFQKLCPPRACQDNGAAGGDTIGSLLLDLGLVWMHIVLPEDVTDELPPVTDDWAEFGETRETAAGDIRNTRGGAFAEFIASIDGQPGRLHFIHSMLPHMPFEYVPSGRRYHRPDDETRMFRMSRLFERASAAYADTLHQRHLAQVGFVDRLIGDLLVRLREAGSYDKAVIVVTADHGASYREGRARRRVQPQRNLSEILRVPLIVRLPGQQGGQVVDRIVESVDILPTILDVIGAKASLRLDGRSLVDSNVRARSTRTFIWRSRSNVTARTFEDSAADRTESLERKARRFGRGDGAALYAPGAARHLLGMNVTHPSIRPARDVEAGISNAGEFKAVSLERDPLPLYVAGALRTSRPDPLTVAVAVNGIVTAVTHSYRDRDAHVFGTLIPESSLREGHNAVAALVVEEPQE